MVGVGWNCGFNLFTDKTEGVSIKVKSKVNKRQVHHASPSVCLLPALTLTVLDEGQFNELRFLKGHSHQLHRDKKTSIYHLLK